MGDAFPESAWGRGETRTAHVMEHVAATSAGSWLIRKAVPLDRRLLERSDGRFTILGPFGTPLLLLTTTGRARVSHAPRRCSTSPTGPALPRGEQFRTGTAPVVEHQPARHPDATVAIGGTRLGVTAELLAGDERLRAWDRFASKYEPYRVYVSRTERQIRVFSLRRASPQTDPHTPWSNERWRPGQPRVAQRDWVPSREGPEGRHRSRYRVRADTDGGVVPNADKGRPMDLGLDGKVILVTGGSTVLAAHCVVAWSKRAPESPCAHATGPPEEAARGLRAMAVTCSTWSPT